MVQQINLYHDGLKPRRERWRAAHGLWALGATLAAGWALSVVLDATSARRQLQAQQLQQQAATERRLLSTNGGLTAAGAGSAAQAELERLRVLDESQRRVQAALQAQAAGRVDGYTPYFMALSRQAHPALWITGFSVAADGEGIELQGRMTDASVLPGYLRRLNAEAQFKGRSFAQLSLKTPAPAGGEAAAAGFSEFLLRTQLAGTEAAR